VIFLVFLTESMRSRIAFKFDIVLSIAGDRERGTGFTSQGWLHQSLSNTFLATALSPNS
jgi:hypothetical protein